jgi:FkbM family methyltransferase
MIRVLAGARRAVEMVRVYKNWPLALADRVGFVRAGSRVRYRMRHGPNGPVVLSAEAGKGDVRVINEHWIYRPYLRYLPFRSLESGPVIVDIGCHRGYFTVYVASLFKNAIVYCFEPDPGNFEHLISNLRLNNLADRCRVERLAITPRVSGKVSLYRSSLTFKHTTIASETGPVSSKGFDGSHSRIWVDSADIASTLASVVKTHGRIDLLKLDTEGTERELLARIPLDTLRRIRHIVAEVEYPPLGKNLIDHLSGNGCRVVFDAPYLYRMLAENRLSESH